MKKPYISHGFLDNSKLVFIVQVSFHKMMLSLKKRRLGLEDAGISKTK